MTCHIMKNNCSAVTFCGKYVNGPGWPQNDTYVEELSRRVMEMPNCRECRIAFHEKQLAQIRES
jgi:hypothetical protein